MKNCMNNPTYVLHVINVLCNVPFHSTAAADVDAAGAALPSTLAYT